MLAIFVLWASTTFVVGEESLPKPETIQPVANPKPHSPSRLQLDDAIGMALANHPQLRAAEAAVARQRHLVFQATRKPNPVVGYTASEIGQEGEAGQQGVFVSQNIVTAKKLQLDGAIKQREVFIAERQLEVSRLTAIANVRAAYLDVAVLQQRLTLLRRLQASLDGAVERVENQTKQGNLGRSALLQAKIEARRNKLAMSQVQAQNATSRARLGALLGGRVVVDQVDPSIVTKLLPPPEAEATWSTIVAASPEMALASVQRERASWQVRRAEVEPVPDLRTQWTVQQDAATNFTVFGVQVGVELPIHDKNRGAIQAARAETQRTHHAIDGVARSLRVRLANVMGRYFQSWQQLELLRTDLQKISQENLTATERDFWNGDATYLDLLNSQRTFISIGLDALDLQKEVALTSLEIDTLLVSVSTR